MKSNDVESIVKELNDIIPKYEPKNKKEKEEYKRYFNMHKKNFLEYEDYLKEIFYFLNNIEDDLHKREKDIKFTWKLVYTGIHFRVKVGGLNPEIFIWQDFQSSHIKYGFFDEEITQSKVEKIVKRLIDKLCKVRNQWYYFKDNVYFIYVNSKIFDDDFKDVMYQSCLNKINYMKKKLGIVEPSSITEELEENKDKLKEETKELENDIEKLKELSDTEKEQFVKRRRGQGKLRELLLKYYGKCKICGLNNEKLLITSHIKPWSKSTHQEKTDLYNCFLLCPNHDALFENGYISFDKSGKILISNKIDKKTKSLLNIKPNIIIELEDENQKYLTWHRKNKYKT